MVWKGEKKMKNRAAWVIPSFIEGSGGHRTIFQNMQFLIDKGYECHAFVEDDGRMKNSQELSAQVEKFFGKTNAIFHVGFNIEGDFEIIFATAWYTAKVVRDIKTSAKKAYFIQDFEAYFNPMGDGYLLACNSYCYGLQPVTIGKWLTQKMHNDYKLDSQYFDFCADHKVYKKLNHIQKEKAVCFIYQPEKPRRCNVIGIEALGILKYLRPDVKIYLYGSREKGNVWFEHTNLGIVNIEECNKLYNTCTAGLCISSSNPSRIPFEMMSAGLPVVDLYMENNLYDMPDQGVLLAHTTPESIAEALINILDNEDLQREMSRCGIEYMKDKSLETGFEQFYLAVENMMNEAVPRDNIPQTIYKNKPVISQQYEALSIQQPINNYNVAIRTNSGLIEKIKNISWIKHSKILRWLWKTLKTIIK